MPKSLAKREANTRYDEKTYVQVNARLRIEDDADLIQAYKDAQTRGLKAREWLRELFENQK